MPIDRTRGFRFGAFTAEPLKGCVTSDDGESRHLPPKAMDVLVRLAEAAPEPTTREDLINSVWGERFVSDEVLTHAIKELRHALGDSPTEPQYIQTIPKRGYQLLTEVSPIADPAPVKEGGTRRYLVIAASLVIAFLALDRFVLDPAWDAELSETVSGAGNGQVTVSGISVKHPKSVAVLPFDAMSDNPDDGFIADGMSEELLNALSQLPELRVTGRTSSFFFKGKDHSLSEISERLRVAYVVAGSVRRNGETLRIAAHLIRTSDDSQIWSMTYDEERSNVLAVQTDVAEQIAAALGILLDDEARERMRAIRINDVEAFIAYQNGLEIMNLAHGSGFGTMAEFLEKLATANAYFDIVIAAQPNLSAPRVHRLDRAFHVLEFLVNEGREEQYPGETEDAHEALQAEVDLAWRMSPYGNQRDILNLERTLVSDNWTGLSAMIQRALQPGVCPTINVSESLGELGFAKELAVKLEESLACDPLNGDAVYMLAAMLTFAGRPQESLDLLDLAEATGVKDGRFNRTRLRALIAAGRFDDPFLQSYWPPESLTRLVHEGKLAEAQKLAEQAWAKEDGSLRGLIIRAAIVGDRARANELAARLDAYPGSARDLLVTMRFGCMEWPEIARGCRDGVPFDLNATPNFKARIEESGLPWPPIALRDASTDDSKRVANGE